MATVPESLQKAQMIHQKNIFTRKRAFATIAESINDAATRIRQRFSAPIDKENEDDIQLIQRTVLHLGCIYKDSEAQYNENFHLRIKRARMQETIDTLKKENIALSLKETDLKHHLDNKIIRERVLVQELEDTKKRNTLLEKSVEAFQRNDECYSIMRSEILKHTQTI